MKYQPKPKFLYKKTILITGAGDGIGKEAALTYASYGANLILIGKKINNVKKTKKIINKKFKVNVEIYSLNFLKLTNVQAKKLVKKIKKKYKYIDGLLHNAAILGEIKPIIDYPIKTWYHVIQVNLHSSFILTKNFLPLLLKAPQSSLIFTSSTVGKKGRANWGAYSVSKFGIESLMQILSDEYKNTHLRVNCINPGKTQTKMRKKAFPKENFLKNKTPNQIMPIYLYLMSEDSIHISGLTLNAQ
ncbi:MAG: YciK family oxidoreductase [Arsenophonus sp.]|nr:MAG: YciK family oxidoreductase [Arsenophonus sp.]